MSDLNRERWSKEALGVVEDQRGQSPPGTDEEVYLLGVLAGYLAACEKHGQRWVRTMEYEHLRLDGWRAPYDSVRLVGDVLYVLVRPPAPPLPEGGEVSERPSWMPSEREMIKALLDRSDVAAALERLIERVVIKGQIEAYETMEVFTIDSERFHSAIRAKLNMVRARLAELEGR